MKTKSEFTEEEWEKHLLIPYKDRIEMIYEFLNDWKSQDDFDKRFGRGVGYGKFMPGGISGDALILGNPFDTSPVGFWIDLLQHLVFLGKVEQAQPEEGQFYYKVQE